MNCSIKIEQNWNCFFSCHQHVFLTIHLNLFSIIDTLNGVSQNLEKKGHTVWHSVQSWHFGIFPFYLISFQLIKHTCICFSMLMIKTIFTPSNHLTVLALRVTIKCTQPWSWASPLTLCRFFPCHVQLFPVLPRQTPWGRFFSPSIDCYSYRTKEQICQFKWQKCVVLQLWVWGKVHGGSFWGCEGRVCCPKHIALSCLWLLPFRVIHL